MSDLPDAHPTPAHSKFGGFLQQSTAGLPNWAWILVIGAGIAAAIIIPKFVKGSTSSDVTPSASGLGLAVDPATGMPYAIEGLVPSGGIMQNSPTTPPRLTPTTPPSTPTTTTMSTRSIWPEAEGKDDPTGGSVPIWLDPNADWSKSLGNIPLNQQIQVGTAVQGNYFGKPATYYPVTYKDQSGYIGSWDLASAPAGSTGPRSTLTWPQSTIRSRHMRIGS